jgi:enolase
MRITHLDALEILDSRGRPTLAAMMELSDGTRTTVSVPSGASTGKAEASEKRDGEKRYRGLGCRIAAENVRGPIARALRGTGFASQDALDRCLIGLDGAPDKSHLGANAILAVSLAFARACAQARGEPLFQYFAELQNGGQSRLPQLSINLFSGGKHAFGQVAIQDVLIVPIASQTVADDLALAYDVYQAAADLAQRKYRSRALTADEGGLSPPFRQSQEMIEAALAAVIAAGYQPGTEVALAIDAAASHFFDGVCYQIDDERLTPGALIDKLHGWAQQYPIVSIEDGLAEEDWEHWPELRAVLAASGTLTVADDLTCTNPARIQQAIESRAADGLLLKVNQIGTITEALEACGLARSAGWKISISARSGETEDDWLADLAVGWSGDFIKVGSITQSDRLAKYNRLLRIEHEYRLAASRILK